MREGKTSPYLSGTALRRTRLSAGNILLRSRR